MNKGMFKSHGGIYNNETWLTPPALLRALGEFDLDPCACPEPRPWPTARNHISMPDDGLAVEWSGRVFCNPPYGSQTGRWLDRMAAHGNGIALIFARTETEMFHEYVWLRAHGVLFLRGRLNFHDRNGKVARANAGAPSCLVAYGEENAFQLSICAVSGFYVPISAADRTGAVSAQAVMFEPAP